MMGMIASLFDLSRAIPTTSAEVERDEGGETAGNDALSGIQRPTLNGHDMHEITVSSLQTHFAQNHFSVTDYTKFCLDRIRTLNPYLEAVIEINPDALHIARSRDVERMSSKTRPLGPLHGIPILVKDNIATNDKMQTTAGSWALLGSRNNQDAFVVKKLRETGVIILGHSNMSEWASMRSSSYSTGYSPRGGQTRNPYDLRKTPFGSSSGSAVAVSANLVPISLGTETDTSVIGPASINGVVGVKPTVGLTSRHNVIPISENMDTVGAFGRTMADAVLVLDTIAGDDPKDPFTQVPERRKSSSYAADLSDRTVLKGAKFGLPVKRCWELCPPGCKEVAQRVLDVIVEAGGKIIEVDLPSIEERVDPSGKWNWEHGTATTSQWTVVKVDAYNNVNAYLSSLSHTAIKTVEDVAAFNRENDGTEGANSSMVPGFKSGQDKLLEIVNSKGNKDETYRAALAHIHKQTRENGIDAALILTNSDTGKTTQLDALLFCDRKGIGQQYAAQAGYPIICIPIGLDSQGMPVSLSIQHSAWKEDKLVKWASAIEDLWRTKMGARPTPGYKNFGAKNIPIEKMT